MKLYLHFNVTGETKSPYSALFEWNDKRFLGLPRTGKHHGERPTAIRYTFGLHRLACSILSLYWREGVLPATRKWADFFLSRLLQWDVNCLLLRQERQRQSSVSANQTLRNVRHLSRQVQSCDLWIVSVTTITEDPSPSSTDTKRFPTALYSLPHLRQIIVILAN